MKDVRQSRVGDTITSERKGATEALGRLPRPEADGVLGPLPDRRLRLPAAARRARQAQAQRRRAGLRARDVAGAGLRLPVRVPRPAAHGDRARAARARGGPRPHLDGAQRHLPRVQRRRRRARRHEPERVPDAEGRQDPRAHRALDDHPAERVRRHGHGAVPAASRNAPRHGLPVRGPRRDALHAAAGRDRVRLLRPAQVAHARLRVPRLRADRRAGGRPRQGRHPAARRRRRRVQRDRPPGQGDGLRRR